MKTSVKIITTTGGLLLALAITSMIIFKRDVGAQIQERISGEKYRLNTVHSFNAIEILSGWDVEISQDATGSVEVVAGDAGDNSLVSVEDGLLRLGKRIGQKPGMYKRAKIRLPHFNSLSADSGTIVQINGFKGDSIAFRVAKGSQVNGIKNQFATMIVRSASPIDFTMKESEEK